MGNEESTTRMQPMKVFDSFTYTPVSIDRGSKTSHYRIGQELHDQSSPLLKTAYHGVWSMSFPDSICPTTRMGQCHVYDPEMDKLVIAYGVDPNGVCLNDVWSYSFLSNTWQCINKCATSPRQLASSALMGRKMVVFGGCFDHNLYSDLHFIDIDTGEVTFVNTEGPVPSPRTSPVVFVSSDNSIYIWSGYDGSPRGGIHVLHPSSLGWHRFERGHTGRVAAAFCQHNGRYFVFGSCKGHGLLEFDPSSGEFTNIECTGTEPARELTRSSLVSIDEYLFLIGGEADSQYMHIFAFDIQRKWWFAFHVRPDMKSMSLSDGSVNKIGLFMLPREHSAAISYRPHQRELVSVLGSRLMNPPPVFRISMGPALSVLHMRSDMLDAFQFGMKKA